ncbi:MAG: flagellar basal-body rod protein FlgG [Chthonomonadaceae bacterium]|nr:flagellar basal-body rod protein FlgG [Chthonomonadaceae bacterium]
MMRALTTAATGMVAQQTNLDVIANNLANANTNGFKSQRAEFQDLMYQTFRASGAASGGDAKLPAAAQVGLGSRFAATSTNFSYGSIQATGNPFDVAINGEGFFKVTLPDGSTAYTRDGSFKPDANGLLVTNDGYPVDPQLTVPTGAQAVTIAANGTVTAVLPGANDPQPIGNITLAVFPNPAGLTRVGQNLYKSGGGSGDPVDSTPGEQGTGSLQQRFLEGSNVQIVEEMVRMISAQRSYEINSKAIQTADDMLGTLNSLKR